MSQPFIQVKNLCYSYQDDDGREVPVLRDLTLDIHRGEYVVILGHNGSGKSTFAKLLNMILEANSGQILIDGKDITSPDMTDDDVFALRRKIGMVFQNPDNQLVATIVEEDIAFGPENLGLPSEEIRRRVDDALEAVGMTAYAGHEPHRLSGGQKQRIAIAGIIAMQPECMIFDESTAMLDPSGRRDVIKTIETLNRERDITVIAITHYMNEAARADRVIIINDGKVAMDGTPNEIFSQGERLAQYGLDVPQGTALIHRLRERGISLDGDCTTPEQCADTICAALAGKGEK
ncbi:MAG: energy-coupling factor transporter ATPase [Clostridia bacterium]|nr:energy-coupling factor transporter ATPase [Clostridia bacterium]